MARLTWCSIPIAASLMPVVFSYKTTWVQVQVVNPADGVE